MADSLLLEALAIVHNPWRASAYLNGAQTAATTAIVNLDTIVYDPNGNFNTGTHLYTAAVDGIYRVSWRVCTSTANIDICSGISVNGSEALRAPRVLVQPLPSPDRLDLALLYCMLVTPWGCTSHSRQSVLY